MPDYNLKYAQSIKELADKLGPVQGDVDKVLDLLLTEDAWDFGSASWFLTTQCTPEVRSALQQGTQEGWEQYITQCVGTTVSDERKVYWDKAMEVL